jgi:hypothetical protein
MARQRKKNLIAAGVLTGAGAAGVAGYGAQVAPAATSPGRPDGLAAINATFGPPCEDVGKEAWTHWPHGNDQGNSGDYVKTHALLAGEHLTARYLVAEEYHNSNEVDRAVWGYACRTIAGSSKWSTHAWGAAVDTNSVKNQLGNEEWNGIGDDGVDYKEALPEIWTNSEYVNHYWGIKFSGNPDPMHFQYATGY